MKDDVYKKLYLELQRSLQTDFINAVDYATNNDIDGGSFAIAAIGGLVASICDNIISSTIEANPDSDPVEIRESIISQIAERWNFVLESIESEDPDVVDFFEIEEE